MPSPSRRPADSGMAGLRLPARTPRPRVLAVLLAALTMLTSVLALPDVVAGPARAATTVSPLALRLTSLSPAVIPASGPITVAGMLTNHGRFTLTDAKISLAASTTPYTTSDELAQALGATDPAEAGSPVPGTTRSVGVLAPGATVAISIKVRRADLPVPRGSGVYWLGVDASATSAGLSVYASDRTVAPVVVRPATVVPVALVLPLRGPVRRTWDDRLRGADSWARATGPNGRLERILRLVEGAGQHPLSLLVDPAVIDAVRTVGLGNPPGAGPISGRNIGASPVGALASAGAENGLELAGDQATIAGAASSRNWLARFKNVEAARPVLSLGYADPDLSLLTRRHAGILGRSAELQAAAAFGTDIQPRPVFAPISGDVSRAGLAVATRLLNGPGDASYASPGAVIVADHGVTHDQLVWRGAAKPGSPALVFASSRAAEGGPQQLAADPTSALQLRQRLLAEAALRVIGASARTTQQPIVDVLPPQWDPGPDWQRAGFFSGLDQSWIQLTGLPAAAGEPVWSGGDPSTGANPPSGAAQDQIHAARQLIRNAGRYADLLAAPGNVAAVYDQIALETISEMASRARHRAVAQTRAVTDHLRERLTAVRIIGSSFVTLSGSSGTFVVTLANDLDQSVKVGIKAQADSSLKVTTPDLVRLPGGQRTTIRIQTSSSQIGVQDVTLTPVTRSGFAVGTPTIIRVRVSEVSGLIWAVMGLGAVVLVVMIGRRLIRRDLHVRHGEEIGEDR